MSDGVMRLEFKVGTDGLSSGLNSATAEVDKAMRDMRGGFHELAGGAQDAHGPINSLSELLREQATHMRTEQRMTGFLSREIGMLGLASGDAGGKIAELLGGFAIGGGFGAAIGLVKILAEEFAHSGNEAKEFTKKMIESVDELQKRVDKYVESLGHETEAEKMAKESILPLRAKLLEQQDQERNAVERLSAAKTLVGEAERAHLKQLAVDRQSLVIIADEELKRIRDALQLTEMTIKANEALIGTAKKAGEQNEAALKAEKDELAATKLRHEEMASVLNFEVQKNDEAMQKILEDRKRTDKEIERSYQVRAEYEFNIYKQEAAEEEAENKRHADAMARASAKALQDQQRTAARVATAIEHSFMSAFRNMIRGSADLGQAMEEMFLSVAEAAVGALVKMAAEQIAQAVIGKAANTSNAQGNIATAVTGAAASQASIPIVGPELAAAAAAETLSLLEGLSTPLLAAAGGFDVPAGLNPITQLHSEEMVLPASLANQVRDGAMGGDINVHFNAPVDRVWWQSHQGDILRTLNDAVRRGRTT